jgi:hypothetical protein
VFKKSEDNGVVQEGEGKGGPAIITLSDPSSLRSDLQQVVSRAIYLAMLTKREILAHTTQQQGHSIQISQIPADLTQNKIQVLG